MKLQSYVERLLAHLGIEEAEILVEEADQKIEIQINIPEDERGVLIGYHGETLAALQRIIRIAFKEIEKKILCNINDYRQNREEKLKEMTVNIAQRVLETGEAYTFNYLPANERFIVHNELSLHPEFSELESFSEGEKDERRLIIAFKE